MKAGALRELIEDEVLESDIVRMRAWIDGAWVYFKIPEDVDFKHEGEVAVLEVVPFKNGETKNLYIPGLAPAAGV